MVLLAGEQKLVTSNDNKIILTTQRIIMRDVERSYMQSIEIFLEDIAAVEVKHTSKIKLLQFGLLGVVAHIALFYNKEGDFDEGKISKIHDTLGYAPEIVLMASLILIGWWWFSRQHILSVTSKGGSQLNFRIEEIPLDKLEDFIQKIQQAKAARIKQLYKL